MLFQVLSKSKHANGKAPVDQADIIHLKTSVTWVYLLFICRNIKLQVLAMFAVIRSH